MKRNIIIGAILSAALISGLYVSLGLGAHIERKHRPHVAAMRPPPPPPVAIPNASKPVTLPPVVVESTPTMKINVAGMSIDISEQTPWESIFKMLFIVLGTYAGIRLTNKYIK